MAKKDGIEIPGNIITVTMPLAPPPVARPGGPGKKKELDFEALPVNGFVLVPAGLEKKYKNAVASYNSRHSVPNDRGETRLDRNGNEILKRDPVQKLVMRPLTPDHVELISDEQLMAAAPDASGRDTLPQLYGIWRVL